MEKFSFSEKQYNTFAKFITEAEQIVVISHSNPDGDAVGAAFAVQHIFANLKKEVVCIFPNRYPNYLNCLQLGGEVLFDSENEKLCREKIAAASLIVCVDFNNPKRVGSLSQPFIDAKAVKVLIDHHEGPDESAFNICFSTINISSASELVYWLMHKIYPQGFLTKAIAECLYTGISTDTGSFSYSCNYPSTYKAVIDLIDAGVDAETLHTAIYNNYSEKRLRLLGHCLKDKLKVMPEIGAAYIYLTAKELEQFDFQEGDTEGIVNYTLSMGSINVGVMLTEQKDKIRISFRSKHDFDVNKFAQKYFGGGGHKKASGATYLQPLAKLLPYLEEALTNELKK